MHAGYYVSVVHDAIDRGRAMRAETQEMELA